MSDNGTQFAAEVFDSCFFRKNGIRHTMATPYHPLSNGLAREGRKIVQTRF